MVKRQLDEKEKELTTKNLNKQKATLEILKRAEEISQFQIAKSIPFSFEQELETEKIKLKRILNKMEEISVIIKVTEDQLVNGIEEFSEKEENQDGNNETKE